MKRKIKERANLIQLTFSALNKSGLIFACFLLGGLVFAGVSFWRTLQEDRHRPNIIVEDGEPPISSDSLSEQEAISESSYDTYKNIAFKSVRKSFMFEMIFEGYPIRRHTHGAMIFFDRLYGKALKAQSLEGLDYILKTELDDVKRRIRMPGQQKENFSDFLVTTNSSDEIRKELDLDEYKKDYKYLNKKDSSFKEGIKPPF